MSVLSVVLWSVDQWKFGSHVTSSRHQVLVAVGEGSAGAMVLWSIVLFSMLTKSAWAILIPLLKEQNVSRDIRSIKVWFMKEQFVFYPMSHPCKVPQCASCMGWRDKPPSAPKWGAGPWTAAGKIDGLWINIPVLWSIGLATCMTWFMGLWYSIRSTSARSGVSPHEFHLILRACCWIEGQRTIAAIHSLLLIQASMSYVAPFVSVSSSISKPVVSCNVEDCQNFTPLPAGKQRLQLSSLHLSLASLYLRILGLAVF